MKLANMLKSLFAKMPSSETAEMRSIVIMQREAYQISEEELRTAGECGWSKKFDGKDDPMYFVSAAHPAMTVVKAGPHIIRVTFVPGRYGDDDEFALSHLPQAEQKKAWIEHRACAFLHFSTISRANLRGSRMQRLMRHWRD